MELAIYSLLAFAPILTAFLLLTVANRPASQAMPVAYIMTVIIALVVWQVPFNQIAAATFQGIVVTLEIVYIVFGAILLLNILQESGALSKIRQGLLGVSRDRRVQVILITWLLGSFIEAASGFGSTAVICVPLLVAIGFPPMAGVLASVIIQPTASSFGAVGTPFIIGVNNGLEGASAVLKEIERLGLGFPEYIDRIGAETGVIQGIIGTFIPLIVVMTITANFGQAKSWKDGWEIAGFCIFAGLAVTIPYVFIAIFVGPAFPSLVGSLIGMLIIIPAAKAGFLLPKHTWDFQDRSEWPEVWTGNTSSNITPPPANMTSLLAWLPYILLGVTLYASRSRFLPLRDWLQSFKISFSNLFGSDVTFTTQPLFLPASVFVFVAIITCFLHRLQPEQIKRAIAGSGSALVATALAIGASVPLAQVFINSHVNARGFASMPLTLADGVSSLVGQLWPLFAPFIGTIGSFVSGSATVSNMMFSLLQFGVAEKIGASTSIILALQAVGAAAGNMVAIANIVPAVATVGLMGREGLILRQLIPLAAAYLIVAGLMGLLAVFIF